MTLTRINFDPRTVLTGAWGGNVADEQGADPGPSVMASPDHGDGIDYEPDASAGVVIGTYAGGGDAAEIGTFADASSGAGRLGPADLPATSGWSLGWNRPPSQSVKLS